MEESIVFDPNIDDRALDREASKVDQRLEQSGTITPDIDDSQLGDIELDGVGGVSGGGGVGGGEAAGIGALASKIPKPIAGVAVSAAIPVALGGAVGAGMLSAMHSASARLQTSTSMIGQAWSMFWRPFGNRLDELFIRDLATGLLSTMVEFNEIAQNEGLVVGIQWLAGSVSEKLTTFSVDLGEDLANWAANVSMDLSDEAVDFAEWAVNQANDMGSELLSAIDKWIGSWSMPQLPNWSDLLPQLPSWTGLTPSLPTWSDLEPDLPDWADIELDLPDWLERWTTEGNDDTITNPPEDTREPPQDRTGDSPTRGDPGGGGRTRTPPRGITDPGQPGDPISGTPTPQPDPGAGGGFVGLQRGGVVNRRTTATMGESGAEVVQPLSEFERMIERVAGAAGGGEVDMSTVERKLDRLHRDLRALSSELSSMTIEVDEETLGRTVTSAQHRQVFDSDPLM